MIRILHVVPDMVPYGLENIVAGMVRLLDRSRFQPADRPSKITPTPQTGNADDRRMENRTRPGFISPVSFP